MTYSEARSLTPAEKAMSILNQLALNHDTSIPLSSYGIQQNGVLSVEIDDTIANQPLDVYKQRLIVLLGDMPMDVKFGHFVSDVMPTQLIPKDLSLNFSIRSTLAENSTIKDLHFRFFHADTNTTINNVSFLINATKGNKILLHDLFYAPSGFLTIHLQPKNSGGNWTVFGAHDPILGGWMSKTGEISMLAPTFTEGGLYHLQIQILTLDYANSMVDPNNPPKFDSWWFMDGKGNISEFGPLFLQWMRNTYKWWSDGQISDQEYNNEIQYMIDKNMFHQTKVVYDGMANSTSLANEKQLAPSIMRLHQEYPRDPVTYDAWQNMLKSGKVPKGIIPVASETPIQKK